MLSQFANRLSINSYQVANVIIKSIKIDQIELKTEEFSDFTRNYNFFWKKSHIKLEVLVPQSGEIEIIQDGKKLILEGDFLKGKLHGKGKIRNQEDTMFWEVDFQNNTNFVGKLFDKNEDDYIWEGEWREFKQWNGYKFIFLFFFFSILFSQIYRRGKV